MFKHEAAVASALRRPKRRRSFLIVTIESTDRYMSAFTKVAGRAPARLLALAVLSTLPAATIAIAPATAQQKQAKQPAPPQTPNDDLRLATELGFEYRLSPQWRLRFDSQLILDHDIDRARNLQLRPSVEYELTPNWAVVGGYVQYQPFTTQLTATRGPFQDIAFGRDFGYLSLANRLRTEELFSDANGALLIRTRYRLSAQHPIGDSPWSVLVSDEIYFNLKTDGTGRTAGFDRNKFYGGLVLDVGRGAKVSAGYELTEVEPTGGLNEFHTIKLGFAFALN
ncbi:MAG TPA: DUF2490 domain-containing protein [Reyranella sp.]|nr:DUF2490 domain-containing protein [Reyranella sp.]